MKASSREVSAAAARRAKAARSRTALNYFHLLRVPTADTPLEVTRVGQQSGPCGTQSEDGILDGALAAAYGFIEDAMMLAVRVESGRRREFFVAIGPHAVGRGTVLRVLVVILAEELVLRLLGKGIDRVAGLGL